MELKIFDASVSKKQKVGKYTVRVNFKIGTIIIGVSAMNLIGLKAGDQVKIGFDEKEKEWFIWKVVKDGFVLRSLKSDNTGAVIFNSIYTTEAIAKSEKYLGDSAIIQIGTEAINSGGDQYIDYWPIITASLNKR